MLLLYVYNIQKLTEGRGFIRSSLEWNMGMAPYFAHKWNQTLTPKLRLAFVNIRNSAKDKHFMFHSVNLFSQAPLACGSRALPSVLSCRRLGGWATEFWKGKSTSILILKYFLLVLQSSITYYPRAQASRVM